MDIATSNLNDEQFARVGCLWIRYRDAFYAWGRITDKWDPIMSDLSYAARVLHTTDAPSNTVAALKRMLAVGGASAMITDMERLNELNALMRATRLELQAEWNVDVLEIFPARVKD